MVRVLRESSRHSKKDHISADCHRLNHHQSKPLTRGSTRDLNLPQWASAAKTSCHLPAPAAKRIMARLAWGVMANHGIEKKPPVGFEPTTCGLQSRPAGFFSIVFLSKSAFFHA